MSRPLQFDDEGLYCVILKIIHVHVVILLALQLFLILVLQNYHTFPQQNQETPILQNLFSLSMSW